MKKELFFSTLHIYFSVMALCWKGKGHTELENIIFAYENQSIGKYVVYEIQIEKKQNKTLEQRSIDYYV